MESYKVWPLVADFFRSAQTGQYPLELQRPSGNASLWWLNDVPFSGSTGLCLMGTGAAPNRASGNSHAQVLCDRVFSLHVGRHLAAALQGPGGMPCLTDEEP